MKKTNFYIIVKNKKNADWKIEKNSVIKKKEKAELKYF